MPEGELEEEEGDVEEEEAVRSLEDASDAATFVVNVELSGIGCTRAADSLAPILSAAV